MGLSAPHVTDHHRAPEADGRSGPLVWQRTDRVGTELVFPAGGDQRTATGSAVLAGPVPHSTRWDAELDADSRVRALTVTCAGRDWSRTLRLARDTGGAWTCRAEETGDLGRVHSAAPPGIEDPARLHPQAVVRLGDSPIFLTWALHRLRLVPGDQPVSAPTLRILLPSLAVLPGVSTYQLVSDHRLRVSGDEPAAGYELGPAGIVTSQPGRLRLAR